MLLSCDFLYRMTYTILVLVYKSYDAKLTFSAPSGDSGMHVDPNSSPCFIHADIKEAGISVSMALCISDARRKHVYTSSTNEVELHIINENQEWTTTAGFIFEFEGNQSILGSLKSHLTDTLTYVIDTVGVAITAYLIGTVLILFS